MDSNKGHNTAHVNQGFETEEDSSYPPNIQNKVEDVKYNDGITVLIDGNVKDKQLEDSENTVDQDSATDVIDKDDDIDDEDYSLLSFLPNYAQHKETFLEYVKKYDLKVWFQRGIQLCIGAAFIIYFICVLAIKSTVHDDNYWCNGDGLLIILVISAAIGLFYFKVLKAYFGKMIYNEVIQPAHENVKKVLDLWYVQLGIYAAIAVALGVFLIVDTRNERQRLTSLVGIFVILLFGFVFSTAPRKINWRHVVWGLSLQFLMGLMILRWNTGRNIFKCLGDKVHDFLVFTDEGSTFVFGSLVTGQLNNTDTINMSPIFAFKILTVVLFFSFCIQILYYFGIMQWIVIKVGWLLQISIGTTACESVNASANVFLGMTEAPLLIKPYIDLMTKSELHAVMTGGFATVAGSVLAAFINFGVSATHLLGASVMSAPAALAYSKLFYPETKKSKTSASDIKVSEKGEYSNVLHAAQAGVTNAIPLVTNIAANLVAFISFIGFFNSVFNWSCQLVNIEKDVCTLENMFGYIFMPLAWLMGVEWKECYLVGELVGLKTIVNEFVAYIKLADMKKKKLLSYRAETIATYALCGFSNISSIGIQLGALGALAPNRRGDLATLALRAMIAGSCACFLTACIAGTLIETPEEYLNPGYLNDTTEVTDI